MQIDKSLVPSTIFFKDGTKMKVHLSLTDTQKLVETFINGSADIVNVENHPHYCSQAKYFLHIDVNEIKAIGEGY